MFRAWRSDRVDDPEGGVGEDPEFDELLSSSRGPDAERDFEELFHSVYADLHNYVVRKFGFDGAEDICAETFATAFSRWGDAPESLIDRRRWTFGIARRKILEAARARTRRALIAAVTSADRVAAASPDEDVAAVDRTRRLLGQLPPAEREAVYLTAVAGLSAAQAGAILGCSVTAITSRVCRARSRLVDILAAEERNSIRVD